MITHIEDAYEPCPECGSAVPLKRSDPPAPRYDGPAPAPLEPFAVAECPSCGAALPERATTDGGSEQDDA
jgi:predicted RNA-binding Zn-ribbon protein involved in translation (DUF1610 family)